MLSEADIVSFLSPIRKERNRAITYEWMKKWNQQSTFRTENSSWNDSAEVVLCKYSQLNQENDSTWQDFAEGHYFPNEDRAGVYFDVMTLSIVRQAEHYSDAQKFIAHCQNSGYNDMLNRKLNRFPIYEYLKARTEGPKFYPVNIDELLQYHDVLSRMFDKLN